MRTLQIAGNKLWDSNMTEARPYILYILSFVPTFDEKKL